MVLFMRFAMTPKSRRRRPPVRLPDRPGQLKLRGADRTIESSGSCPPLSRRSRTNRIKSPTPRSGRWNLRPKPPRRSFMTPCLALPNRARYAFTLRDYERPL